MRDHGESGVVVLDRADYADAGQVLGRAFSNDPLWSVLMPDIDLRSRMFAETERMITAGGGIVETTPGVEAVALWMPPGRHLGTGAFVRSGFAPVRWLVRTPWRDLKRMTALQSQVQKERKSLLAEPHWCLEVLGVDPVHHGRGVGSAMVGFGLRRADDAGEPMYVDTSAPGNVGFYERFGFGVVREIRVTDLRLPFWMMIRPSRQ